MSCSQSGGFRVMMTGLQRGLEEVAVGRRLASAIILLAALVSPAAYAQVNIDQGKAPAQIYESTCAACHKSMRGLANGRSASALTSFLSEHYTSSSKEAAAVAAYVLGGGGGVGTPAPARAPTMKPEPATASTEEPKDREPRRSAKPEGDQGPAPKSQRPSGIGQKPATANQKPEAPGQKPDGTGQKPEVMQSGSVGTGTRMRGQVKPVDASAPTALKPTTVIVVPSVPEGQAPIVSPTASAPAEAQPSADVPRDNIPD
jgi:mono/diheme cytochrome c family protein